MNIENSTETIDQEELFEVLQKHTTLGAVRSLLKEKGELHSARSWSDILENRVLPCLEAGSISVEELIGLIREAEEHDRKHVRLFRYQKRHLSDVSNALQLKSLEVWIKKNNLPTCGRYHFAAYPKTPVITEVRLGDGGDLDALILKVARTESRKLKGQYVTLENGTEVYQVPLARHRAVDVVKLHSNGLIEVRLHPRTERPISYSASAEAVLKQLDGLISRTRLGELSLATAKDTFSDNEKVAESCEKFEAYEAQHKNDKGDRIQSSSLADQGGLSASNVMTGVIKQFTDAEPGAYCERVRVSYLFDGAKKINAILTEDTNEIVFTASLSRKEYEEALHAILEVNTRK